MVKIENTRKNEVTLYRDEPQSLHFTIQDEDGDSFDLTSNVVNKVEFLFTQNSSSLSPTVTKQGINLTSEGDVEIQITGDDTKNLSPGVYEYILRVELDGGQGYYVAEQDTMLVKNNENNTQEF